MPKSAPTPPRFADSSFGDLPKSIQEKILNVRKSANGIYLHGPIGVGKTHAAHAMVAKLREMGIRTLIYTAPALFDLFRDDFGHKDSFNLERLLNFRGLLFIDDLGVEKPTDWVIETLYKVVNTRYEAKLPMYFTSNLDLGELADRVGDRIASRIAEMCDVIKMDGPDRRLL